MFLPHAIDMLNRRNFIAIKQLEACAPYIANLEKLCGQLDAELRDVKQIDNKLFAFEIAMPAFWHAHRKELEHLLHDFGYWGCAAEEMTGKLVSVSGQGHKLVMTPINSMTPVAA